MVARLRLTAEMHAAGRELSHRPYRGPVLIVDAGEDALVSTRQRNALRALYPHARCAALADKGHVGALDDAPAYIAVYMEFLNLHSVAAEHLETNYA